MIELWYPLVEDVEEQVLDAERGQRDFRLHETPNVQNDSAADHELDVGIRHLAGKNGCEVGRQEKSPYEKSPKGKVLKIKKY